MTKRQELTNLVKVEAAKANRTKSRNDFRLFVDEMCNDVSRLADYLYGECSRRSRKMFITKAHKKAQAHG